MASDDLVILEPDDAKNREALFTSTVNSWVENRSVNLKIGVLNIEGRNLESELWIEFDPTVEPHVSRDRIILPFVVDVNDQHNSSVLFNIHNMGGCSSILKPNGSYNTTNKTLYLSTGKSFCETFIRYQQGSTNPQANNSVQHLLDYLKLWHQPYTSLEAYSATFDMSSNACYHCQSIENIAFQKSFNSISLSRVVNWFQTIDFLDIDAQGMDVSLILSLNATQLSAIKKIKLECQGSTEFPDSPFNLLYHADQNYTVNECAIAQSYLESNSFNCTYEINNCGCAEFNLHCESPRNENSSNA